MKLKQSGRPADAALRERRCEEILETAATLFAQHGYSGTDTQVLADRLGVGKGTLYRYFRTKRELFLAAVDRVMRRLRQEVDDSVAGIEDPVDRVARGLRVSLDFFAAHPEFAELLIQERAQFKDRTKPTYFVHQDANVKPWRALFRSLMAAGRVRDMPAARITDVLSDLVYGTMFTNYFAGQRKPPEAQARDILDIVFYGILSRPERRRRGMDD
jgi:AcrR family transcriptional regulator